MIPMVFGDNGRQLYGVYHPAVGTGRTARGYVLCNPEPLEAVRANRAYRTLANTLARRRSHVLRFDYFGTGDSGGETQQPSIDSRAADIGVAIDALKSVSGVSAVTLVGLRDGAEAAGVCSCERMDVQGVIAWDPVCQDLFSLMNGGSAKWFWLTTTLDEQPSAACEQDSSTTALSRVTITAPAAWLEEQTFGSGPIPSSAIDAIAGWR